MKKNYLLLFTLVLGSSLFCQAPDKSAPFTAVKWEKDLPWIILSQEDKWHQLYAINGTEVYKITAYCRKKYGDKWQKRFSEDLVEVLTGMGQAPEKNVKLTLRAGTKYVDREEEMTTENRKKVWEYNNTGNISSTIENKTDSKPEKTAAIPAGVFKLKACKITYEYSGITEGSDVFYFDEYGKTALIEQTRKEFGGTKKTIIWKDGKSTIIDHTKKTVAQSPFRSKDTEPPTIVYVNEKQRETEGYVKLKNETIAGKDCEVYEHTKMKVKYWLWNNIDLRLDNYALGKTGYVKKAIKVEEVNSIPVELLIIPSGYEKK